MTRIKKAKITINDTWFGLLMLYIISNYIAQDLLMPSSINSLILYVFLAYSMFAIFLSGKVRLTVNIVWELTFLILCFVAMLYSPSFSGVWGTYYALIVNFILVFIFIQMPWNQERFNCIMKTFVFASVVLIVLLSLTGNLGDASGRLGTELVGNANQLAMMLMVSAIYSIWLLISTNILRYKLIYLMALAVIYLGIFLSGGRKYVVVPIIFAYIVLAYKTDKKGRKHLIKNTLIIVSIMAALYLLIMEVPYFYDIIGYRFEGFLGLFDDSYSVDSSTLKRQLMIDAAWKQWKLSPMWGYGFDSFKYYNAQSVTGYEYYSHNNFLELLYNQGIIGFVGYYWFYVYLMVKQRKQKNTLKKGFVVGMVISLLVFEYFGISYSVTPVQTMLFYGWFLLQNEDATGI